MVIAAPDSSEETVTAATQGSQTRRGNFEGGRRRRRQYRRQLLVGLLSIALGVGVWTIVSLANPRLVPNIADVWSKAAYDYREGVLVGDVLASLGRVALGFVIGATAGIAVGIPMGWYRVVRELANPWVQFFRMVPPLALIPVVIIYIGIGESAKVIVIVFAVFLTVVIAAFQGVTQADAVLVKAARTLGATDRQLFRSVILPGSVPYILVGLRLGLAAGWTTVVAAELIAASSGLGYLVEVSGANFTLANGYLAIILIGLCGIAMDITIVKVSRAITPWQDRVER